MVSESLSNTIKDVSSAELFQKQWNVYRKVVDNNDLCHRDLIDVLTKDIHESNNNKSVAVLDLGCGDSYVPITVFENLQNSVGLASFTGVDASRQALDIAEKNLKVSKSVRMIEGELEEFVTNAIPSQFDIILANFVLHHFSPDKKKELVRKIFNLLAPGGIFYFGDVYNAEPGSDRESMMLKWRRRFDTFKGISGEELEDIWKHVYEKDFPETLDFMEVSMVQAGFENVRMLFKDGFYSCCFKGQRPLVTI